MKKQLEKYLKIVKYEMASEYAETMGIIREEFDKLDNIIFKELKKTNKSNNKEIETTLETTLDIIDNFKNSMFKMLEEKIIEKKPFFIEQMTKIIMEGDNLIKNTKLIEPMMEMTISAYDIYIELSLEYIYTRLCNLMNVVEHKLGVRDITNDIENLIYDEELDIKQLREFLNKLK